MQIPRNGTARPNTSRTAASSPEDRNASAQRPNAPTPGRTTADAADTSSGSETRRASAPRYSRAFCAERRFPIP